jgi:exodeoxyribonuclease VII large subunit
VISAVGHETDFPICDLAADLRAPTPTAAGNRVVPDRLELEETLRRRMEMLQLLSDRYLDSLDMRLMDLSGQAESLADHHLLTAQNRLARWQTALETSHPAVRLEQMAQKATGLALRLNEGIDRGFERVQARLESLGSRLHALGPRQALERGYAIALKQQGTIVMSPEQVKDGEGLRLMVKDGIIGVTVGEGT